MNERMTNKNALSKRNVSSAGSGRKHGMIIGISGKAPGVSRSELRTWAQMILRHLQQTQAELSLALVTDPMIHALNRQYRGKDKPTDVLSFPLADEIQPSVLGDVVISVDTTARQAQQHGHSLGEELQILLIHGILHLLGYDHEVSRGESIRMRRKEQEILQVLTNEGN